MQNLKYFLKDYHGLCSFFKLCLLCDDSRHNIYSITSSLINSKEDSQDKNITQPAALLYNLHTRAKIKALWK